MHSLPHSGLQRFLDRLLSRTSLSYQEQQAVLGLHCRPETVGPRQDLVAPGETISHACLVAKGIAGRFDQMRNGQRQITAFHIAGDMCDLHSVVAPTAAWGISTLSGATVLFIPHKQLTDLAQAYPAIAFAFWRDVTVDGSILAKWVGNLGRQDARARIAHIICELGVRMESAGLALRTSFSLDITQEQLADAAGLTAVHVNRTLQGLRCEGLIETRGRAIEIGDWEALAEAAEFDPAYLLPRQAIRGGPALATTIGEQQTVAH